MLNHGKSCWICGLTTKRSEATLRGGLNSFINTCSECMFQFFDHDNFDLLVTNQLDQTRLKKAGLEIPDISEDYENGIIQSKEYIKNYIAESDISKNILEIGCSWGYFVDLLRQYGAIPYGLEINPVRANYVNNNLGITCYQSLEEVKKANIKFHKIFMFYILEYIPNPIKYIDNLIGLLDDTGKIVIITPNLNDVLKDIWKNPGYNNFFYDECAIAYYSVKALKNLATKLNTRCKFTTQTITEQGYSILNHINWFFTNRPRSTGIVGGDSYIEEVTELLAASGNDKVGKELATLIKSFDTQYRNLINKYSLGNRIILTIAK